MLNEIRLNVGTEHCTANPAEITPRRYSSLILRIKRVFGRRRGGGSGKTAALWQQVEKQQRDFL